MLSGLGIFSWFSYQLPIQERLQLIKEAGFNTTALWHFYHSFILQQLYSCLHFVASIILQSIVMANTRLLEVDSFVW